MVTVRTFPHKQLFQRFLRHPHHCSLYKWGSGACLPGSSRTTGGCVHVSANGETHGWNIVWCVGLRNRVCNPTYMSVDAELNTTMRACAIVGPLGACNRTHMCIVHALYHAKGFLPTTGGCCCPDFRCAMCPTVRILNCRNPVRVQVEQIQA